MAITGTVTIKQHMRARGPPVTPFYVMSHNLSHSGWISCRQLKTPDAKFPNPWLCDYSWKNLTNSAALHCQHDVSKEAQSCSHVI